MSLTNSDLAKMRKLVYEVVEDLLDRTVEEKIETAKEEICKDFRTRITAVQDAIVGFHEEWRLGVPPMVKVTLDNHEKRIVAVENKLARS
ncbi:MAG: hypothetical protein U9Q67_03070 [Patescibacteria group bacterium]|nr:hypothetical protein [Patescibacteria group bacterium]